MWNGKMKAVTLSYDDGAEQDLRLISLLNHYGIWMCLPLSGYLKRKRVFLRENSVKASAMKPRRKRL